VDFGPLSLKNPMLVASGPASCKIEQLVEAERRGAAGVSIKHVMSRQARPGRLRCYSEHGRVMVFPSDRRLELAEGLALIREAKERTSLVVLVNYSSQEPDLESYGEIARRFEEAGADGVEINMCCPNFSLTSRTREVGPVEPGALTGQNPQLAAAIVRIVKEAVRIPVIPKLTPTAPDVVAVARACEAAGADGLSLVGGPSLGAPPVDLYDHGRPRYPLMGRSSFGALTGSAIRWATFKIVAEVAQQVPLPITASGGVDTWEDAAAMMMWGARSVGVCTALMWRGFEVFERILRGLDRFLEEQGYASYEQIVGLSLQHLVPTAEIDLGEGAAVIDPNLCRMCGLCLKPAHCDAIVEEGGGLRVVSERCLGCGVCVELCPHEAIRMEPAG
jgi:dihydroorotate dehydrogenase subfamily 1